MITEFRDLKTEPFWMGAVFGIVTTILVVLSLDRIFATPDPSAVNMPKDIIQAYNMGHKDALKTNPAGLELEQACLELWANKQR
jgi:hypothetical protein